MDGTPVDLSLLGKARVPKEGGRCRHGLCRRGRGRSPGVPDGG